MINRDSGIVTPLGVASAIALVIAATANVTGATATPDAMGASEPAGVETISSACRAANSADKGGVNDAIPCDPPRRPNSKETDPGYHRPFFRTYGIISNVGSLPPGEGTLRALAHDDPGLAADLIAFSTLMYVADPPAPPERKPPEQKPPEPNPPQPAKPPQTAPAAPPPQLVTTVTLTAGAALVQTTAQAAKPDEKSAPPSTKCKVAGFRPAFSPSGQAPRTVEEALAWIDANAGNDACHDVHVEALAKALISRSNTLCARYVSNLDFYQRGYRTGFLGLGTIMGAIGAFTPPAAVFSGISSISTGLSGVADANAFAGQQAYLLATAIVTSQAQAEETLYARLGMVNKVNSGVGGAGTSPSGSGGAAGTAPTSFTLTYTPGTKTTQPSVTVTVGPAKQTMGQGVSSGGPNNSGAASVPTSADLAGAPIGTIYSAILSYHSGCTVWVGLDQLHKSLNASAPSKSSDTSSTSTNTTKKK